MTDYLSWGRLFKYEHEIRRLFWLSDELSFIGKSTSFVLPHGLGRSYGDSCLNDKGVLIDMSHLNRFRSFDEKTGILECEAGVTLAQILDCFVPRGWFPPVTPGTKFVTVGGAIANNVHGKNHHQAGNFGDHVVKFEIYLSNGSRKICSPRENPDLFQATIGGLGLTGLITWAQIQLTKISSPLIDMETIKFASLNDFFQISDESDSKFAYTVAWVDCISTGPKLGRGLFMRGNHAAEPVKNLSSQEFRVRHPIFSIPCSAPNFLLNHFSMKLFNEFYYNKQRYQISKKRVHYEPFFYPLDAVDNWNRLYGSRGFFQHQFVLPEESTEEISSIFKIITDSGLGSSLAVLKKFGKRNGAGLLSFPKAGVTLALDFANSGEKTMKVMNKLDDLIVELGGRKNPSKDATMSGRNFRAFFNNWQDFSRFKDPKFSSSFWRRVMEK